MRKRVSLAQRNAQRAYKLALALIAGSEGFGNSWMAVIRLLTAVKMGVNIPVAHWLYFVQMANGKWQMAMGNGTPRSVISSASPSRNAAQHARFLSRRVPRFQVWSPYAAWDSWGPYD